jgi:hypothetical protein
MALTDDQKSKIRHYLGYPDVNRRQHTHLESAFDALSTEGETRIAEILVRLAALDTDLDGSWDRQKVSKAEEVTLAGFDEVRALRSEGTRICYQLGGVLDVPPRRSPFRAGPSGGVARRG